METKSYSKGASLNLLAQKMAGHIATAAQPKTPQIHLIEGAKGQQLFVPNGSQLIDVDFSTAERLKKMMQLQDQQAIQYELLALGVDMRTKINDTALKEPPLRALSLAMAQKCNLGCSYCYADQGDFGGPSKNMSLEMALQSIDMLINGANKGDTVQLTFLGGEPLMNRVGLRLATEYAANLAEQKQVNINFSTTSNGTLIRDEDIQFFEEYGFAITISLDGLKEAHDRLRPLKNGKGTYEQIMTKIRPLLSAQRKMQVSARVTVTAENLGLATVLDEFINMGFHSVGFSPLLNASNGKKEMSKKDLEVLLTNMIECGLRFEQAVLQGKRYPFLNMINAFKEISNGTHRPYPCGAGAGYMGVSADGDLYACHRFVNEESGAMGSIQEGINSEWQHKWLHDRHVHQQSPCTECWARYLCGGGCHHEVIEKGRVACDYIRGWLHFAIQSYERVHRLMPNWNK